MFKKIFIKIKNELSYTMIKYRFWKLKKFYKRICIILYIVLGVIFGLVSILTLVFCYISSKLTLQEFIGDIILWFSAIVVLIYVIETYKIRREAVRQNNITITPLLIISTEYIASQVILKVKNIGHGIAFGPKIENQKILEDESYNYYYEYKIEKPFISPQEESKINVEFIKFQKAKKDDAEIKKTFKPLMGMGERLGDLSQHKFYKQNNFSLKINYTDIGRGLHYSDMIIKLRDLEPASLYDFK